MDDILDLYRYTWSRIGIDMEGVDWELVFSNTKSLPRLKDNRNLVADNSVVRSMFAEFVSFQCIGALNIMLKYGASCHGLGQTGNLYLTEAVLMRSTKLVERLMDSCAPFGMDEEAREAEFVKCNFNGGLESNIKRPIQAAFELKDIEILDVIMSHPRYHIFPTQRGAMFKLAAQEFEKARNSPERHVEFQLKGQRYIFLGGGLGGSVNPDCVPDGEDFRSIALGSNSKTALHWYQAVERLRPKGMTMTVNFKEGAMEVDPRALERFAVFRDKLSSKEFRFPVGILQMEGIDVTSKDSADNSLFAKLVQSGPNGVVVDFTGIQADFPDLSLSAFSHLVDVMTDLSTEVQPELIPQMDRLCEALGLECGMGHYILHTADHREVGRLEIRQEGRTTVQALQVTAKTFMELQLPADCWRIKNMAIEGCWEDQNFGGTGANGVTLEADTVLAGEIKQVIHKMDHNSEEYKRKPVNVQMDWSAAVAKDDPKNALGRSLLEVMTGGDTLHLILQTVSWGGWSSSASNSAITVEYFKTGSKTPRRASQTGA